MGRLYSSAYYALHDTRTPLRFARDSRRSHVGARLLLRARAAGAARHRSRTGARPGSRCRPASRDGSSSRCCARASTGASATPEFPVDSSRRLWGSARRSRPRSGGWRGELTGGSRSRLSFLDAVLVLWRTDWSISARRTRSRFPRRAAHSPEFAGVVRRRSRVSARTGRPALFVRGIIQSWPFPTPFSRRFRICRSRPGCISGATRTERCCTSARRNACGRACAATSPRDHVESLKTRALMLSVGGARDDRRAERGARADSRSEPDQGVPPEVQHRAARRQVVSVHQGHGRRAVSARVGDAASRRRRQSLLRPVHRRRRDASGAERREADLHGSLVQLRHAEADARAAVPRLLHQAVQGAVHPRADAGRVSRDDRRGAASFSTAGRGKSCGACASECSWPPSRSTSSAPPNCATRCSISSGWKSRRSCCRSKAAIATWSATRATATTPSWR